MDYLEWNNRIAEHFFNPAQGGREVLLYVNEELIEKLGKQTDSGLSGFISAIKSDGDGKDICTKALGLFEDWRSQDYLYPPYIGFLSLFVLADTIESERSDLAYYPNLWKLLGDDERAGSPYQFEKMLKLWDDLEKWSKFDCGEEIGKFTARITGGMWKIGLPRSQTLLSVEEREALPQLFSEAGLESSDPPAADALPAILLNCPSDALNKCFVRRTRRILSTETGDMLVQRDALLGLLLDELAVWDGWSREQEKEDEEFTSAYGAYFRLCVPELDVFSNVEINLRVFTKRPFPDEPIHLNILNKELIIKEYSQEWSKPLLEGDVIPRKSFDAKALNWEKGLHVYDKDSGWKIRLLPGTVKLFLKGGKYGIKGWVESRRIEGNADFLVACYQDEVKRVEQWGNESCASFAKLQLNGIPKGWVFFKGNGAKKSLNGISCLTISNSFRLKWRGGIRMGLGNTYLDYALPDVFVENGSFFNDVEIIVEGQKLKQRENNPERWMLPDNLPLNRKFEIKAKIGDKKPTLYLKIVEPEIAEGIDLNPGKTPEGETEEIAPNLVFVRGSDIVGGKGIEGCTWKVYPTYLGESLCLIGSQLGQVVEWPTNSFPKDWNPVWAIVSIGKREYGLHFCGVSKDLVEGDLCVNSNIGVSQKDIRRWVEVVWIHRKLTTQPGSWHS